MKSTEKYAYCLFSSIERMHIAVYSFKHHGFKKIQTDFYRRLQENKCIDEERRNANAELLEDFIIVEVVWLQ